ncbi:ATP-binding protein [Collinsella aerofaciens]|uniref:ATP-binding protein n=1 Tax=Collinsella aerofaciens TaxID=74426 RepID=UPI0029156C65|nr:ATP-binding protein [Collinsella aerofaciens]MDU8577661.1 ATP-binding protein [Collinsella aerofaciens]
MQQPIATNDVVLFSTLKENQYFDRKSARKDDREIAKHISAFANAAGGKLVVGIEDNGEVTGFRRNGARDIENFERAALATCTPTPIVHRERISVVNSSGEDDLVLVLDIEPSTSHSVARMSDGDVFLRQNDKSVKLNREQVIALEFDKGQRIFEDELVKDSSIDDVDHEVLDRYKEILGTEVSDEQVLRSRRFMRDGKLTVAGALLFAQDPSVMMPQARVRILRYDGVKMETGERLNITKERCFCGPLPKVIQGAYELISSMLREFQFLGPDGKFQTVPEYPEFAWFEGLVNAVTHRDYSFRGDYIRISMFDDRMEIISPGALPNIVTLDNMRTTRYSRNPRIARTLVEFGWVRELNEGVQRIYTEMQNSLLGDPVYSEPGKTKVQLTLENNIVARTVRRSEALEDKMSSEAIASLSEYELAAIRLAFANGKVTARELAAHIGRDRRTANRVLSKLIEDGGLLEWHGSSPTDPRQFYKIR